MAQIGITNCRMIPSNPVSEDRSFFNEADLILLAGGDTEKGMKIIRHNGFDEKMVERYHKGAVLMGVSAGAVQLGLKGWRIAEKEKYFLMDTLKIVPYVIDVHDNEDWARLHQAVGEEGKYTKGFGIPVGGGAVFHEDWSIEAIRHPLVEYSYLDVGLKHSLIFPPDSRLEVNSKLEVKRKKSRTSVISAQPYNLLDFS
jgi:cyanophycinase-like exopeptidase